MSDVAMSDFARTIVDNKYAHLLNGPLSRKESWPEIAARQARCVVRPYLPELEDRVRRAVEERKLMPGGRYLYAAGRKYPQVNNCFLFRAADSREGWGNLGRQVRNSLMTGGGVGVVYSDVREEDAFIAGMGGKSTGPLALAKMTNEEGRYIRQGGSRRSAIWAGIHWNHPDALKFVTCKDWDPLVAECRRKDFNFPAPMDGTNVSIILDDAFFEAYHNPGHHLHGRAHDVYWSAVRHMLETGEPGFSIDCGDNEGENLRNACTEVTSRDDGDMCNLASLNLARIDSLEEFTELVELGTAFLMCGTLYSKLPLPEMYAVREKNRRLGLGLMGVHEWLLRRGYRYGPADELGRWMDAYAMSGSFANRWADKLSVSRPVATRAVAPTGTISIAAETTSGGEPMPAVAYKRRYLDGATWKAQIVIDPTARRLVDAGYDPELIEDSMTLAEDYARRIDFQAWLQKYVDHGISSTINLPRWGTSVNNEDRVKPFGEYLLGKLPELRGITAYPDGARGGQPINRMTYRDAVKHVGRGEFVEGSEGPSAAQLAAAVELRDCKDGFCSS